MEPTELPPPLDGLYRYWSSKLRGRTMPSRADIDPCEITHLLPIILLTEVIGDYEPRFRYRLVGTEVVKRFGLELTGRYVDEVLKGDYGVTLTGIYKAIVEQRQPFFTRSRVVTSGGTILAARRLMLPLSADGERVNMVFTGQIFDYDIDQPDLTMWMIMHAASDTTNLIKADPILLADPVR